MCVGVLSLCVVILGVALPAAAQTFPRTEISGGYQFVTFTVEDDNESIPKGWYFEVAGRTRPESRLTSISSSPSDRRPRRAHISSRAIFQAPAETFFLDGGAAATVPWSSRRPLARSERGSRIPPIPMAISD